MDSRRSNEARWPNNTLLAYTLPADGQGEGYERLRNLTALVLAAAYFAAVWLGESLKLAVLTSRVTKVAKRFFGVPEFHYYALADGLRVLLSRRGMNCALCRPTPPPDSTAQLRLFNTS